MNPTEWSSPRGNDRKSLRMKTQTRYSVTSIKHNIGSADIHAGQSKPVARDISSARNRNKLTSRCSTVTEAIGSQNLHKPLRKCNDETFSVKNPLRQKFPKSEDPDKVVDVKPNYKHNLAKQPLKKKLDLPRANSGGESRIKVLEEKLNAQNIELAELQSNFAKLEFDNLDLVNDIERQGEELVGLRSWKLKIRNVLVRFIPDTYGDFDEKLEMLLLEKFKEAQSFKDANFRLMSSIRNLEEELARMNLGVGTAPSRRASTSDDYNLETETASFLEKVSNLCKNKSRKIKAHSKDENVKINLKITVRKEKNENKIHKLSFSDAESPALNLKTPYQTFSIRDDYSGYVEKAKKKVNKNECDVRLFTPEEKPFAYAGSPHVCEYSKTSRRCSGIPDLLVFPADGTLGTDCFDVNNDNCRASLGTFDRAEDLDMRLKELWDKLSCQGETLERLKSEKRRFTFSVDLLEEELTESRAQHKNLVEQVNVAKKLFS